MNIDFAYLIENGMVDCMLIEIHEKGVVLMIMMISYLDPNHAVSCWPKPQR